jgi:hypothetical protein
MAAYSGTWKAWLNGYGVSHTDSVSQSVTIPATTSATLSFWLRIDTAEATTSTVYDRLRVQVISGGTTTTLASYSNLNATGSYLQRRLNVSTYAGRTVTLRFIGIEDSTAPTSFLVDDTSLTTG